MIFLYKSLLYIHVASVILSIGPFFILIPMVKKLKDASVESQQAYLETFRYAVFLAKHAGHVLVASGILLVFVGSWSWTTSWILLTILLLVSSLFFLARAFSPTLRTFSEPQLDREQAVAKLHRAIWTYLVLLMTMLWFMVTKPILW